MLSRSGLSSTKSDTVLPDAEIRIEQIGKVDRVALDIAVIDRPDPCRGAASTRKLSAPRPPDRTSFPGPPLSVSLPEPPNSRSVPGPPDSESLSLKPDQNVIPSGARKSVAAGGPDQSVGAAVAGHASDDIREIAPMAVYVTKLFLPAASASFALSKSLDGRIPARAVEIQRTSGRTAIEIVLQMPPDFRRRCAESMSSS